jgi:predicted ATPase
VAIWALGDVERASRLIGQAIRSATEIAHVPTAALANGYKMSLDVMLGDAAALTRSAEALVALSQQHGLGLYRSIGEILLGWAQGRLGERPSGMTRLRKELAAYLGHGTKLFAPLYEGLLAELEAEGDDVDGALQRIDEALALSNETGEQFTDALLHRIRGAILLKRDPANPAPAEEAFLSAVAVAQTQKGRSFELQAALALAKLYHSTARPAEAHAVLAPALEGFAPTPEMPEIAEAQALLERF